MESQHRSSFSVAAPGGLWYTFLRLAAEVIHEQILGQKRFRCDTSCVVVHRLCDWFAASATAVRHRQPNRASSFRSRLAGNKSCASGTGLYFVYAGQAWLLRGLYGGTSKMDISAPVAFECDAGGSQLDYDPSYSGDAGTEISGFTVDLSGLARGERCRFRAGLGLAGRGRGTYCRRFEFLVEWISIRCSSCVVCVDADNRGRQIRI